MESRNLTLAFSNPLYCSRLLRTQFPSPFVHFAKIVCRNAANSLDVILGSSIHNHGRRWSDHKSCFSIKSASGLMLSGANEGTGVSGALDVTKARR